MAVRYAVPGKGERWCQELNRSRQEVAEFIGSFIPQEGCSGSRDAARPAYWVRDVIVQNSVTYYHIPDSIPRYIAI